MCFIFFSGQDAFDYFKEDPKLFDVVCYVFFSSTILTFSSSRIYVFVLPAHWLLTAKLLFGRGEVLHVMTCDVPNT